MAYFKLSLLLLGDTVYSDAVDLIPSVISEFYTQSDKQYNDNNFHLTTQHSFCYTYGEKFAKHQNGQRDLSFTLDRMLLQDNEWIENPYARFMQIGTQLCLEDKYNNQYLFTITDIKYTFKLNNISYNITCQDTFSYQLTRQQEGYEITNNNSDIDFIGAKNIDWWAKKIINECHIAYTYLPLTSGLYQSNEDNHPYVVTTDSEYDGHLLKLIKPVFSRLQDAELFETFPFSGSGNAASILISLGEQLGLVINTFEHNQPDTNKVVRYFWFEPAKNNQISGLQYSPFDSVQQFGLSHKGSALTTILNVSGPTYDNELITLLPDISPFFVQLFQSPLWSHSAYHGNMYDDFAKGYWYHYDSTSGGNFELSITDLITGAADHSLYKTYWPSDATEPRERFPMYEYNAQKSTLEIFLPIHDISQDNFYLTSLYDNLVFHSAYHHSTIQLQLNSEDNNSVQMYTSLDGTWSLGRLTKSRVGGKYSYWPIRTQDYGQSLNNLVIRIRVQIPENQTVLNPTWQFIELYWGLTRQPTAEDLTFAEGADAVPWLENKLIDFTYFTSHNLLNTYQYSALTKTIYNDLRIINGQLIYYTQAYYNALHKQTETLAILNESIDTLNAQFNYDIVSAYTAEGRITKFDDFSESYNYLMSSWITSTPTALLNYDQLISDYMSKYFAAQQRFYKNIKAFTDYFEAPVQVLTGDTHIYKHTITLQNDSINSNATVRKDISFLNGDYIIQLTNENVEFANHTNVVDFTTGQLVPYVDQYNYLEYNFATKLANDYVLTNGRYNVNNQYYFPEVEAYIEIDHDTDLPSDLYFETETTLLTTVTWNVTSTTKTASDTDGKDTYRCLFRPEVCMNQERWLDAVQNDATIDILYNDGQDQYSDIPVTLKFYIASVGALKQNYIKLVQQGLVTDAIPTLYIHNTDTYSPISALTYEEDLYTVDNFIKYIQSYEESIKFTTNIDYISANNYYKYHSLDTVFYPNVPNYSSNTSIRTIYNNEGDNLYNYLKKYTLGLTDATSSWTIDYKPLSVSNINNFTNFYHYVDEGYNSNWGFTFLIGDGWTAWAWLIRNLTAQQSLLHEGHGSWTLNQEDRRGKLATFRNDKDKLWYTTSVNFPTQQAEEASIRTTFTNPLNSPFVWDTHTVPTQTISGTDITINPAMFNSLQHVTSGSYDLEFSCTDDQGNLHTSYWSLHGASPTAYWNNWELIAPSLCYLINSAASLDLAFKDQYGYYKYGELDDVDKDKQYYFVPLFIKDGWQDNNHICRDYQVFRDLEEGETYQTLFNTMDEIWWDDPRKDYLFSTIAHYPFMLGKIALSVTQTTGINNIKQLLCQATGGDAQDIVCDSDYVWSIHNGDIIGLVVTCSNYQLEEVNLADLTPFISYYTADDQLFDWTTGASFTNGAFVTRRYDILSESVEDFNENYHYYTKDTNERVYTLKQLVNQERQNLTGIYQNHTYSFETFGADTPQVLSLPVQITTSTWTDKTLLVSGTIEGDLPADIKIGASVLVNNGVLINGTITNITQITNGYTITIYCTAEVAATSTITVNNHTLLNPNVGSVSVRTSQDVSTRTIGFDFSKNIVDGIAYTISTIRDEQISAINNGTFWYKYGRNNTKELLFNYAAAIETQLETYWSQAYNASLYCDYFIPSTWQQYTDNQTNHFFDKLFQVTNDGVHIRTEYIPSIDYVYNEFGNIDLPRYRIFYLSSLNAQEWEESTYYTVVEKASLINLQECFDNLNIPMHNWYLEELGRTNYYTIRQGGVKKSELLINLQTTSANFSNYTGIYPLILHTLFNRYYHYDLMQYHTLKAQHDALWKDLYTRYPSVCLEGNYTNDNATTSKDLLVTARNVFKDKANPERSYNLNMIDNVELLTGYQGQELHIGDPIALRANEFYDGFDDIKDSLSQFLFITDIQYDLRRDTDIALTVNSIKYQDKLLQRLAKLIQ